MDPDLCMTILAPEALETTIWGMPSWACWILIAVLLLVSGLFSAGENAFSGCNKYHFQALADKGDRTAKLVAYLIDRFDNTLVTILVGNNIVQTVMSFLSAMLFYELAKGWGLSGGADAILSTLVMAALVYVVSDTLPKILSKELPNRMARILAYPVFVVSLPLYPVTLLFRGMLALAHRIFKVKDQSLLSKEELIASTEQAVLDEESNADEDKEVQEPLFEKDETEILDNVFLFDKLTVRKVYTPLEKTFALKTEGLTVPKINEALLSSPYSRIPVYEDGDKTEIVGVLVAKVYFEEYAKDPHLDYRSILEEPIQIDADTPLDDAFQTLNGENVHLGVVTEKGKAIGIVSMEDILEELVDDIDEAHEETLFRKEMKR